MFQDREDLDDEDAMMMILHRHLHQCYAQRHNSLEGRFNMQIHSITQ